MDKEPGQRTREAFEACFVGYAKMIMQPGAWDRVSSQQKAAWVQMEAAIEAPHLAEVEQLKAKVEELERERDAIVGKLGEAIELIVACIGEDAARDLATHHASLAQELPPDLPLRTLDAARIPDLNRDEHLDRPKPEQDHVHEVGSCSFCDRALRQGATPCLTWQGPEYGGRCRACGGSKEEHEGRS